MNTAFCVLNEKLNVVQNCDGDGFKRTIVLCYVYIMQCFFFCYHFTDVISRRDGRFDNIYSLSTLATKVAENGDKL